MKEMLKYENVSEYAVNTFLSFEKISSCNKATQIRKIKKNIFIYMGTNTNSTQTITQDTAIEVRYIYIYGYVLKPVTNKAKSISLIY